MKSRMDLWFFFLERYVLKPLGKNYLVIETLLGNIFSIAITFLLHFLLDLVIHLPGQRELLLNGEGKKPLETRGKLSKSIGYGMYASSKVETKTQRSPITSKCTYSTFLVRVWEVLHLTVLM